MQNWVEKYRPKSLTEVVGNAAAVAEMRAWAESWEHGHPAKKAVILAGKPGTGKTSAALALGNDMHWQVIEMNASDSRNADAVHKVATRSAISQTFLSDGTFVRSTEGGRKLIILDEADNLFGVEDRGGIGAIVETIQESAHPIILVANDLYELTRRSSSLKRLTKTIKFQRLHAASVKTVLRNICKAEGVTASEETLDFIASQSQGDLRSAINDLQSVSAGVSEISGEQTASMGFRDTEGSIFDALIQIFRSGSVDKARASTRDLDESPETMILWIDENMPAEYRRADDLERGYDALSKADVYLGRVRRRQHYGLWSYASDMMTGGVAAARQGKASGGQYHFPSWLRKMSSSRGARGTVDSIARKLGRFIHTSKAVVLNDVLTPFRQLFQQDAELRASSAAMLGFDAREVAFLLDESEDSAQVKRLMEEVGKVRGTEAEGPKDFAKFEDSPDEGDE